MAEQQGNAANDSSVNSDSLQRCKFLGAVAGTTKHCGSCGGAKVVEVYRCRHESIEYAMPTGRVKRWAGITANIDGQQIKIDATGCERCRFSTVPRPEPKPVATSPKRQQVISRHDRPFVRNGHSPDASVRNLSFYLCPLIGANWRRHYEILRRNLALFTGVKVASIAFGDGIENPTPIARMFADLGFHVQLFRNDPALREVVAWRPTLDLLREHATPDSITFACHSKGTHRGQDTTCHRWTDVMYETCLGHLPFVEVALRGHAMAGPFKKLGHGFTGSASDWHYSGTFYWFSNRAVFTSPRWHEIDREWWGTESWPGCLFTRRDTACLFHEATRDKLDLYKPEYMRQVEAEYARWLELNPPTHDVIGEHHAITIR